MKKGQTVRLGGLNVAGKRTFERFFFFFSSRRRHTRYWRDWSSDVCSSDLVTTGVNTREIARASRLVSRLTGYAVQPNKAIVGRNAFSHESGIHQDGVLKERTTYEIMDARTVGLDDSNQIVLGKHSGRHALQSALADLGYAVDGQALRHAFDRFKEIADKKKQVTAMDLERKSVV